jgi:dUTP pyrophosphatase
MILRFAMAHDHVFKPKRANPSDAGLDVFFSPDVPFGEHDPVKNMKKGTMVVQPGKNAKLRTGLKFEIPHGYMLQVMDRSSMSYKRELKVGGGVLDPGYSGEVCVIIHNIGNSPQMIEPGDKIAQLVLIPVVHFAPALAEEEELYQNSVAMSNRGSGGFGSTGDR